jgi:RNA polymerase sigma-70 factor, ECF subfamily
MADDPSDVTQLLKAWSAGDQGALEQLAPRVYVELRRMAGRYVGKEGSGKTLQATALVHEVFLRLVEVDGVTWEDRAHFFGVSANSMEALGQFDPRKEKVVELRFFGGLSVDETAAVLKISPQSVMRDWKIARAWLLTELQR